MFTSLIGDRDPKLAAVCAVGALLISAGSAVAQAQPAPPSAAAAPAPAVQDPTLAFYPPAALAAELGGTASVACDGAPSSTFATACRLTAESPARQGFGAAALQIVARAYAECTLAEAFPHNFDFTFGTPQPFIEPDLLSRSGVENPRWRSLPTGADFARYYPDAAARHSLAGDAVLDCVIATDGRLSCKVSSEAPLGQDFGAAALKLSARVQMAPFSCSGGPVAGRHFTLPIHFRPPIR